MTAITDKITEVIESRITDHAMWEGVEYDMEREGAIADFVPDTPTNERSTS